MSSPFGPVPPGVDLTEDRSQESNATVIALYVLAVLAVGLRFYARIKTQSGNLGADDYMIIAALASETIPFACTIWASYYGLAKHIWAVAPQDVTVVMKIMFIYVITYAFAIPVIKLSIILFYRRLFGMKWVFWVCAFLSVGYFVACASAFVAACRPPSYFWTQYADPLGGKCVFNLYPFYIGNAAANVITDGIVLIAPLPYIWQLQMRLAKKIMVSGIFLIGSFVIVASIIRIHYMTWLKDSIDVTWVMGYVFIWSSVEPCIAIVCACLPSFQQLLRRPFKSLFGSTQGGTYPRDYSNSHKLPSNPSKPVGHVLSSKKSGSNWTQDDEAGLTTCTANMEMDSMKRGGGDGWSDRNHSGITVTKDFQWQVNPHYR